MRGSYRWWIGGLLFLSTVINYLDRQTLNVLGPALKVEFSWSNRDFALIIFSFRLAYTLMQTVGGRILDRLGTRRVGAQAEIDDLRSRLGRQLTDDAEDPRAAAGQPRLEHAHHGDRRDLVEAP